MNLLFPRPPFLLVGGLLLLQIGTARGEQSAERAIESKTDELNLVMSTSETHNLANLRMTRKQSFNSLTEVVRTAQAAQVPVNVSLSCVFGCPMEGDVAEHAGVQAGAQRFVDLGARLTLCDTTGMAYPTQVAAITRAARERWPGHRDRRCTSTLHAAWNVSTGLPRPATPGLTASTLGGAA